MGKLPEERVDTIVRQMMEAEGVTEEINFPADCCGVFTPTSLCSVKY